MVFRLAILISFLNVFVCFTQNGTLQGTVSDSKGNVIFGASVIFKTDVTIGSVTNEKGKYSLTLPAGQVRIVCRYSGMKSDTSSHLIVEGKTLDYNIVLQPFFL